MKYSREYIEDRIPKLKQLVSNKGLPNFLRRDYKKELNQLEDMLEKIDQEEHRKRVAILQRRYGGRKRRYTNGYR